MGSYAKIRPRSGTAYEWKTYNPVLDVREFVIETPDTGVGTGLIKVKIGDGIHHYNDLPYAFDAETASSIDGGSVGTYSKISIRRASNAAWYNANPVLNDGELVYDTTYRSFKVGDGQTRFNQLQYVTAGSTIGGQIIDCGDEDGYSSVEAAEESINTATYPENVLPEGWDDDLATVDTENETTTDTTNQSKTASISDLISDMDTEDVEDNKTTDTSSAKVQTFVDNFDTDEDVEAEEVTPEVTEDTVTEEDQPVEDVVEETPVEDESEVEDTTTEENTVDDDATSETEDNVDTSEKEETVDDTVEG